MPLRKKLPEKSKIALIGSGFIVLIIVIIGVTSFFIGKKSGQEETKLPIIDLSGQTSQQILGVQTYNWSGNITKINNSSIILTTERQNSDGSIQVNDIEVFIKPNTQIYQWDVSTPQSDLLSSSRKIINASQLQIGQKATVQSNNDKINNQVEAINLGIIITPSI